MPASRWRRLCRPRCRSAAWSRPAPGSPSPGGPRSCPRPATWSRAGSRGLLLFLGLFFPLRPSFGLWLLGGLLRLRPGFGLWLLGGLLRLHRRSFGGLGLGLRLHRPRLFHLRLGLSGLRLLRPRPRPGRLSRGLRKLRGLQLRIGGLRLGGRLLGRLPRSFGGGGRLAGGLGRFLLLHLDLAQELQVYLLRGHLRLLGAYEHLRQLPALAPGAGTRLHDENAVAQLGVVRLVVRHVAAEPPHDLLVQAVAHAAGDGDHDCLVHLVGHHRPLADLAAAAHQLHHGYFASAAAVSCRSRLIVFSRAMRRRAAGSSRWFVSCRVSVRSRMEKRRRYASSSSLSRSASESLRIS